MNIISNQLKISQPINSNINFTSSAKKIMHMKSISGAPCACCGKEMILPEKVSQACLTITKPFIEIIKKGALDCWKQNPAIWYFLLKLANSYPNKSLDQMLKDEKVHTKFKKKIAHNVDFRNAKNDPVNTAIHDIRYRSRAELKGAKVVIDRLSAFKPFLEGAHLEAFEQLEIYAQKYPRKKLSDIIHMEEIYKYHSIKDRLQKQQVKDKRDFHFNNIMNLIKKAKPENLEDFEKLRGTSESILINVKDPKRRIFLIKDYYTKTLKKNGCEKITEKVLAEIDKIPEDDFTADSFFVNISKNSHDDYSIVYGILNRFFETFEHIIPNSYGGTFHIFNGVYMHKDCNYKRDRVHYGEHIKYHPEMSYNLQKQIDFFANIVLDNNIIGDMRRWPIEVARTFNTYTNGVIAPDISEYYEKSIKKINKRIAKRNKEIAQIQEARTKELENIRKLQEELRKAHKKEGELNSKQQNLKNQNNSETVANLAVQNGYELLLENK